MRLKRFAVWLDPACGVLCPPYSDFWRSISCSRWKRSARRFSASGVLGSYEEDEDGVDMTLDVKFFFFLLVVCFSSLCTN